MSIGAVDAPKIRALFKFLDRTKLSVGLLLLLKSYMERFMGKGFTFKRMKLMLATGQSHLDAAWRWRKKQTVLKAKATFSKALQHMKEHPRFTFAQPSPAYYQWMKESYPAIYEGIKEAVQRGQWILLGGMWVEPDLNVPSGESLVRQRLVGMRFFLDEFGKLPDVEFLQDTFGFCWSLPQILARSGARMFGTGKIFWNDTNKFPLGMFHWMGPDGTALPTVLIHFGYFLPMTYGKDYPDIYRLLKEPGQPGKRPVFDYGTPVSTMRAAQSRELMLNNIFGYGLGDGGHGPIEAEITIVNAMQVLYPKTFKFHKEGDFFKIFKPFLARWPTWRDELYLELHRGVWTTNSKMKASNRRLEVMLENVEKACVVASLLGAPYPKAVIDDCWKTLLFNQFHDILPGSSIYEVYEDTFSEFDAAFESLAPLLAGALDRVVPGGARPAVAVSNHLSWPRQAVVPVPGPVEDGVAELLGSLQARGLAQSPAPGSDGTWLVLARVGPMETTTLDAMAHPPGDDATRTDMPRATDQRGAFVMENACLEVTIDKETGHVTGIVRKRDGFQVLAGPANRILLFTDKPRAHHAWEIDPRYKDNPVPIDETATRVSIIENGPVRCGVEVEHVHGETRFVQRVHLCAGESMVRFSMDVEWHQVETLFKLSFPLTVTSEKVSSGIPYAYIDRPTVPFTPMDKARWEYPYQGWIDVSDGVNGVAVLNDTKYGFNIEGNEIRPTVLNGPEYAGYARETMFVQRDGNTNPTHVDQGFHSGITHVLMVHDGDWRQARTWRAALELANPLLVSVAPVCQDREVPAATRFEVSAPNVAITAVKVAEDERDLQAPRWFVLRLVEMEGAVTPAVTVSLPPFARVKEAYEVNLLELDDGTPVPVPCKGSTFTVAASAHEIKTVKVLVDPRP